MALCGLLNLYCTPIYELIQGLPCLQLLLLRFPEFALLATVFARGEVGSVLQARLNPDIPGDCGVTAEGYEKSRIPPSKNARGVWPQQIRHQPPPTRVRMRGVIWWTRLPDNQYHLF